MRYALSLLPLCLLLLSACSMTPCPVGIMNFENATGSPKYAFLSSAIPEYLTNGLANKPNIYLRERQSIARYLEEVDAMPADSDSKRMAMWQQLGRKIEADFLIAGSVSRLDHNFIIIARLFSVYDGEIVPGSAITQTCIQESEIYDRSRKISDFMARQIGYRTTAASNNAKATPAAQAPTVQARDLTQLPAVR